MAPLCKLTYFDMRAYAEPIRLLLHHANIEFEDVRTTHEEWRATVKPTTVWGKVPYYEEGDFKLSQSMAILKYLADTHGYAGETKQETARMEEMIGAFTDILRVFWDCHMEQDAQRKAEKEKKLWEELFPDYLQRLDGVLKSNEGSSFLVGKKVSYADFYIVSNLQILSERRADVFKSAPGVQEYVSAILNLPGVKEWVARRPVTPF